MNPKLKTALTTAGKFGSGAAGLTLGTIAMSKIPVITSLPAIVQKMLPGTLGMVVAFFVGTKFSDEYIKAAAMGLGLAGFAKLVANLTAGGTGIAATINAAIPAGLGRLGYNLNTGAYPPSYYLNSRYPGKRLGNLPGSTGRRSVAYQLSGANPYALQGLNPYVLMANRGQ